MHELLPAAVGQHYLAIYEKVSLDLQQPFVLCGDGLVLTILSDSRRRGYPPIDQSSSLNVGSPLIKSKQAASLCDWTPRTQYDCEKSAAGAAPHSGRRASGSRQQR